MDGPTLNNKLAMGYGKAAKYIGFTYEQFRHTSLIDPISSSNKIGNIKATFTPNMEYSKYNNFTIPDWIVMLDFKNARIGDWFKYNGDIYYIADMQLLLPIPAIQCNRTISIKRMGYSTGISGELKTGGTLIGSNIPVFLQESKTKQSRPDSFDPSVSTSSKDSLPEYKCFINTHNPSEILKGDIIIDENNLKYEVDLCDYTSFGLLAFIRQLKP